MVLHVRDLKVHQHSNKVINLDILCEISLKHVKWYGKKVYSLLYDLFTFIIFMAFI